MDREWISVADQLPPVGERVECSHAASIPSYDCEGQFFGGADWQLPNGFVCRIGHVTVLAFRPSHWRPLSARTEPTQ